ncbi:MAG: carbohydrate kinase family protein, partial [Anaerolineae bacterium]
LPERIESLSVSFLVDSMHKRRGGCAPNIAYSLALLGERPKVMGTVGQDFAEYRAWLEEQGIDTSAIKEIEAEFTASYFVSTDQENNQIASFYTGAMAQAHTLSFRDQDYSTIDMTIISPNDPQAMVQYARECQELDIPYIYDPSQQIVRLSGDELREGVRGARMLILNEYEYEMFRKKTALSEAEILTLTPTIVVTKGDRGSTVICLDCEPEDLIGLPDASSLKVIDVSAVPPRCVSDPTGVGDAYRAGVIKGLVRGYSWETIGRLASLAATYVIESPGPQSQRYTLSEFVTRYREHFGDAPELEDLLRAHVASQEA